MEAVDPEPAAAEAALPEILEPRPDVPSRLAASVRGEADAGDAGLTAGADEGHRYTSGRDDREDAEWFLRLPAAKQEELRRYWGEQRERVKTSAGTELRRSGVTMLHSTLLLMFLQVFVSGFLVHGAPLLAGWGLSLLIGPLLGAFLHAMQAERFTSAIAGGAAFAIVQLLGGAHGAVQMLGMVLAGCLFAAPGVRREMWFGRW